MAPHAVDTPNIDHGMANGHGPNGSLPTIHSQNSVSNEQSELTEFDLVCVGFGPANLALAIAIQEELGKGSNGGPGPKVLFLERQKQFAWHSGMLLPGTKMQIHFMKDLATFRNPKSHFTFFNYLFMHDRLAEFTDIGTNLPSRLEYQDYMKWCASHFDDQVRYGTEVHSITPACDQSSPARAQTFSINAKDIVSGQQHTFTAKNVVIGVGGKPNIPDPFPANNPRVIHSSKYRQSISSALPNGEEAYKIAVVGSGQSAAEIFRDLQSRYANASTRLIFRGRALKPSDDSPFVNEIFHPSRVSDFYAKAEPERESTISEDRSTNYSVVRLPLIEEIHETLYLQRIQHPNEEDWPHRILPERTVEDVKKSGQKMTLQLHNKQTQDDNAIEDFECDAIIVAAGYQRNMHEDMLEPCKKLMPDFGKDGCTVTRDYKVIFEDDRVAKGSGVWLQGCNESSHGLSDTLLSILAPRAGELVASIFAAEA